MNTDSIQKTPALKWLLGSAILECFAVIPAHLILKVPFGRFYYLPIPTRIFTLLVGVILASASLVVCAIIGLNCYNNETQGRKPNLVQKVFRAACLSVSLLLKQPASLFNGIANIFRTADNTKLIKLIAGLVIAFILLIVLLLFAFLPFFLSILLFIAFYFLFGRSPAV